MRAFSGALYCCVFCNIFFFLAVTSVQASSEWQVEREVYEKARTALSKKKVNEYHNYYSQLNDYPLQSYLEYSELRARISKLTENEVDAFIADNNDGPLAARLRLAWLSRLQKKGYYESFLKYYQDEKDAALQCFYLRAKIRNQQIEDDKEKYLNQIRDVWLVGKSQPSQCDPLFEWYKQQGYLTSELVWERFTLAMDKNRVGLAKYLSKKLPASEKSKAKLWLSAHSNPKSTLRSKELLSDNHVNRNIIRHGLNRLARKDLTAAHNLWLDIKGGYAFGSDLHDEVDKGFALRAAYRHDERATAWMYQLPEELMDDSVSMWRARSAIRSQDWDLVLRGVAMLTEEEKAEPQWQYWKARALSEKGMGSDAKLLYQNIASERSYHGFLAADKLSLQYNIVDVPVQYDAKVLEEIEQTPSIIRARELLLVDQLSDARREWNFATKEYTQHQFKIAASLAHQWQWHDYAIRTIAKGKHFDDLGIRFPMPFTGQVKKYSNKRNLQPAFVNAIIRRESAFNQQARSPVGARGLMQLMPATARQVSKQLKLRSPSRADLYMPDFNISLGSKYIADMLKKFNGHRALASAAYNAGPHRVNAWLPEDNELPADVWVDTIPFTETREYVRAILAYTAVFEWRLGQNPTRLSVHLQPISPSP